MKDYNEKLDFVIRSVLSRMKTFLPENVLTELCVEIEAFIQARDRELEPCKEITDEAAIYHLNRSGWMQKHDRAMSFDSLTAVVNSLMRDGNKSISVNVYPWKEDDE
jgi:hypothetical protein